LSSHSLAEKVSCVIEFPLRTFLNRDFEGIDIKCQSPSDTGRLTAASV
jgi:hypothetical protein